MKFLKYFGTIGVILCIAGNSIKAEYYRDLIIMVDEGKPGRHFSEETILKDFLSKLYLQKPMLVNGHLYKEFARRRNKFLHRLSSKQFDSKLYLLVQKNITIFTDLMQELYEESGRDLEKTVALFDEKSTSPIITEINANRSEIKSFIENNLRLRITLMMNSVNMMNRVDATEYVYQLALTSACYMVPISNESHKIYELFDGQWYLILPIADINRMKNNTAKKTISNLLTYTGNDITAATYGINLDFSSKHIKELNIKNPYALPGREKKYSLKKPLPEVLNELFLDKKVLLENGLDYQYIWNIYMIGHGKAPFKPQHLTTINSVLQQTKEIEALTNKEFGAFSSPESLLYSIKNKMVTLQEKISQTHLSTWELKKIENEKLRLRTCLHKILPSRLSKS